MTRARIRIPGPLDVDFDVELENENSVYAILAGLTLAVSQTNIYRWLNGWGPDYLKDRALKRFDTEGDRASGKWEDLRPATNDIREHLGYPRAHPINERTGDLRNFIKSSTGDTAFVGAQTVRLSWPDVPPAQGGLSQKFETAQVGKKSPGTPPRPVAAIDAIDLQTALVALRDHIMEYIVDYAGASHDVMVSWDL